jgi:hypothetical protein
MQAHIGAEQRAELVHVDSGGGDHHAGCAGLHQQAGANADVLHVVDQPDQEDQDPGGEQAHEEAIERIEIRQADDGAEKKGEAADDRNAAAMPLAFVRPIHESEPVRQTTQAENRDQRDQGSKCAGGDEPLVHKYLGKTPSSGAGVPRAEVRRNLRFSTSPVRKRWRAHADCNRSSNTRDAR